MDISVIIPNYKSTSLLKKNLPGILKAGKKYSAGRVEIIVVDDGSEADIVLQIEKEIVILTSQRSSATLEIKLIHNEKNLGFAPTVNRGVEEASGEIVVLLNTDVTPQEDFLKPLIAHFEDDKIFAVGCLDKSIEDNKIVPRGRGVYGWKRGLFIHRRGEVDRKDTDWVSGGSGAFRKSLWKKFGGFDTLYNPFYWEDIDISYRALKSGYKLVFEPQSIVEHRHQEGIIRTTFSQNQIKRIAYRNQLIFIWKNITDLDLQLTHWIFLPYHLAMSLLRGDIAFIIGFIWAFIKIPMIITSSLKAQKLFLKSDHELLHL